MFVIRAYIFPVGARTRRNSLVILLLCLCHPRPGLVVIALLFDAMQQATVWPGGKVADANADAESSLFIGESCCYETMVGNMAYQSA